MTISTSLRKKEAASWGRHFRWNALAVFAAAAAVAVISTSRDTALPLAAVVTLSAMFVAILQQTLP